MIRRELDRIRLRRRPADALQPQVAVELGSLAQPGHERREAGCAQRDERLGGSLAEPLGPVAGPVAHAVHGTQDDVGLAEDAAELTFMVLDASVVVDEVAVQPLHERAEMADDSGPTADVGDPSSAEIDRPTTLDGAAAVRVVDAGLQHGFEVVALGTQRLGRRADVPEGGLQG